MPTMTRVLAGSLMDIRQWLQKEADSSRTSARHGQLAAHRTGSANQAQAMARARQIVVDAVEHQLAAQALWLRSKLLAGQPARADDALVQWPFGVVLNGARSKTDALVGDAVAGGRVEVNAGH